jgi:hypothetical protein
VVGGDDEYAVTEVAHFLDLEPIGGELSKPVSEPPTASFPATATRPVTLVMSP